MGDRIDQLYRLPLDQFTPARNALAQAAGPRAAEIKALEKPNAAAWAVNQLFWRDRAIYDELIAASERVAASPEARNAHVAIAGGLAALPGPGANRRGARLPSGSGRLHVLGLPGRCLAEG